TIKATERATEGRWLVAATNIFVSLSQADGRLVRRFTIAQAATKVSRQKPAVTARLTDRENCVGASGNRLPRSASTPYVRGFSIMQKRIQPAAPLSGNSAPESSHRGISRMFTTAWKGWVESIGQAMAK